MSSLFKKLLFSFFGTVFLVISPFSYSLESQNGKSKADPVNNFEKKLNKALRAARNRPKFTVDFTQENYSFLRDAVTTSSGTLSVQQPASFRFEIKHPMSELYVSDGNDFWRFSQDLNHAQHLQAKNSDFGFLTLLSGLSDLKKVYNVLPWTSTVGISADTMTPDSVVQSDEPPQLQGKLLGLKLKPKETSQQKVIYAIVDINDGTITELRIVQSNGNRTRLLFSHLSNSVLGEFHFVPPKGIVVDEM